MSAVDEIKPFAKRLDGQQRPLRPVEHRVNGAGNVTLGFEEV